MKVLHDVNGAAMLLAVSPWTIRAYIRQGKLRAVRIGRLVRLEEEAISDFIASMKSQGNSFCPRNEKEVVNEA
jgi:excisionase family DNA binding protein